MRVLTVGNMYPPQHLGGYELMWQASVRQLRQQGHRVRVLTTDYRNPESGEGVDEDPDVRRDLRWYWLDDAWPRLTISERLRLERHNQRILEQELVAVRPDAVAWWAMGGMSLALIERVRRIGIPAVAMVHDDWLLYGPGEDQWQRAWRRVGPLRKLVERRSGVPTGLDIDAAMRWLLVSETIRQRARAAGWKLDHSTIEHSGIDANLFREHPAHDWRGQLLYVGRIDERKGIATAIRAMPRLEGMRLTVVGGGDAAHLSELTGLVSELGLEGRVSFERRQRGELPAAYAGADVLLFPVIWDEPFGLVPLEAMAVGTPVVATGTGGSAEYLRDEHNCLLFRRGDEVGLARAVERIRDETALRARLRSEGLQTAAPLTEERFTAAVEAALLEVAA